MRVYISGPMTGLPGLNYEAFFDAHERLAQAGYDVINPAREGNPHWTWVDFMRRAMMDVAEADAICMLPGWEYSKGAVLERTVAKALELVEVELP